MENEKPLYQKLDYGLITIVLMLAGFSLIAIYKATAGTGSSDFTKQIVWYAVSFVIAGGTLLVDYRKLKQLAIPFYIVGMLLLVYVAIFGVERKGAQRWIDFGNFAFQPSEVMKVFLIIFLAYLLVKAQEKYEKSLRGDLIITGQLAIASIVPFFFIFRQPDLGTALVLIGIVAVMLLVAGISWRILFTLTAGAITFIIGLIFLYFLNFDLFSKIIRDHQLERIYGWLDPEGNIQNFGYQLIMSLNSIGSGQLIGKEFETITVPTQHSWIPEVHTDFIFAVIGEEFGFIGSSILISLFFILIYRLVQIALTCNDPFGSYLVAGIAGALVFQIFQNIGMTIGLLPITGLALPFISYGGSALMTNMLAIGIVLNVSMRTKEYMFD
ncbi:rod shape-determining protein RodA [Bacillus horti]|uniref:Rod shape-determining protein RodA n=1 Tax=Caldalkalibacillus horti TaxID=77523 RepID=A0ABT9W4H1_9BACI|nr:rod shape-determining protein RodA [Bacillus horti]MDQ0168145.1 rod shape-determining protein RodA [Bacillus horti]